MLAVRLGLLVGIYTWRVYMIPVALAVEHGGAGHRSARILTIFGADASNILLYTGIELKKSRTYLESGAIVHQTLSLKLILVAMRPRYVHPMAKR